MKKSLFFVLVVLILSSLACNLTSAVGSTSPESTSEPVSEPTAEPVVSNELFADDFSSSGSGWDSYTSDDGTVITDYENDAYRIFVNKENWSVWANPGQYFVGDVIITVDVTKTGGVDDNDIGVICRYVDVDNYYLLKFSSDGYAQVAKYNNGEYAGISSEQMEQANGINAGETVNTVRAECVGSSLTLYVNDNLVASATDTDFTGGDVGLYAGTFDTAGTDVLFDNFVVTEP